MTTSHEAGVPARVHDVVACELGDLTVEPTEVEAIVSADFGLAAGVGWQGRRDAALSLYRDEFDGWL